MDLSCYPALTLDLLLDAEVLGLTAVSDGRHVVLPAQAGGGPKCCTLELRS
jgi:hypothetical protein